MTKEKSGLYVLLSLIFSAVSSGAVLLCIMNPTKDAAEQALIYSASSIFWAGLILEQIFIWMANAKRKKTADKNEKKDKSRPGIISFFKTRLGKISDIVFILSFITYIIMLVTEVGIDFSQYVILFLIVLSFRFHCISNGKNYIYRQEIKKRGAKS